MSKKRRNHSAEFSGFTDIHVDKPFLGSRRILEALAEQGQMENRKPIWRLSR